MCTLFSRCDLIAARRSFESGGIEYAISTKMTHNVLPVNSFLPNRSFQRLKAVIDSGFLNIEKSEMGVLNKMHSRSRYAVIISCK